MRDARTRRRAIFRTSVFVTTAAIGAALAPAAVADANSASAPEQVTSITTNADGTISVGLQGDTTPDWVQITVRASGAPDSATLYSTKDVTETPSDGAVTATTDALVTLPSGTAYGDYPVDVDFQLPGGDVQHYAAGRTDDANWLKYLKHASVGGLMYDRENTDWWHRTAALSGHVNVLDPATGRTGPAPAGTKVKLNWSEQQTPAANVPETAVAQTDDNGDFRYSTDVDGAVTGGAASVTAPGPDTMPGNPGKSPDLPIVVSSYRLTAAPNPPSVHRGTVFRIQGKVEFKTTGGDWKPFPADALVYTATHEPDYTTGQQSGVIAAGGTNDSGAYSYPITGYNTTVLHSYLYPSPYLVPAGAVSTVHVPTAGSITLPKFTIDEFATVKTTGRLNGDCADQTLDFQYSANGTTGWRTIAKTVTGAATNGYCSYYMGASSGWDGWYRVYHPETQQMLTVQTQTPRLRRTRTQMSIAVSSTRPANHAKFTVSGVVIQLGASGWVHENKAHVVLIFQPKGDPQRYWVAKGYTNAAGRYTFTLNTGDFTDGAWAAYLDADATHFYSQTPQIPVDIR
jgi:hypothetical protein